MKKALLVAVPVVLVAAGIGVAVGVHQHDVAAESRRDTFSAPVREALDLKARNAMEGGAVPGSGGEDLACAIDLFATDPPAVTDAAAAKTAYVWTQCATVGTEVQSE